MPTINKWFICDHHIAIESEDSILHPSAEEVYSFIAEEGPLPDIPDPTSQLESMRFSKNGSSVRCEITLNADREIILSLYAIRKRQKWPVDMIGGVIIDHAIADNEWFYINNDTESLQKLFANAKIEECGSISIGQYIELIKQELFAEHKDIVNTLTREDIAALMVLEGDVPRGIEATLYNYQKEGYLWIKKMLSAGKGCILGDEMGLGKTLQIITVFQDYKLSHKVPLLVVAPVSLLENWKRECSKFAPGLDVLIHQGANRTGFARELAKHDVVVISYNTAINDSSMLKMIDWKCVVLDEAQNIKNPYSQRAKAVKAIPRDSGIAVTGTPFENHVTDIWSLFDFAIPGLLGSLSEYQNNISDDVRGAEQLEPVISPVMIRRLVKDVANDLPEKVIIPQPIVMSDEEARGYELIRGETRDSVDKGGPITIALLQKLRMFCTHPFLFEEGHFDPAQASIKYQRLCEIVEEIQARNEKVIVFTSYKRMFEIFEHDIPSRFGMPIDTINGETPVQERQAIVDWFNNYDGPAMLVLNPRAAGTGLNITGANHVIHYNLEWNPSLEDQASARAYRRGQSKSVFIYRLYYVNTVEQVVNERIERKREIAASAIVGTDGVDDRTDILKALEFAPEIKKKGH